MMHFRIHPVASIRVLAFASAVATMTLTACETDHSAPRTADFTRLTGELESYEQATLDQTWQACKTAMDRLAFVVTQEDRTDLEGRLLARTQGGREVRIRISKETTVISKVRIRVDTLGDEPLSRVILQQIELALPGKTTRATTSTPMP